MSAENEEVTEKEATEGDQIIDDIIDGENADDGEKVIKAKMSATGIKSEAANNEAIKTAEKKSVEAKKNVLPSLFIDPQRKIKINVEVLYEPDNGRVVMIAAVPEAREETRLNYLKRKMEWFEFTHPDYDDMIGYRESSAQYDPRQEKFLTDPVKLRICYLRYHLIDWSLCGEDGKKIEVKIENESLTQEMITIVGKLTPAMVDVIMTEFEKETLLGE